MPELSVFSTNTNMRVDVAPENTHSPFQVGAPSKHANKGQTMSELRISAGFQINGENHPQIKRPKGGDANSDLDKFRNKVDALLKNDFKEHTFWSMKRRRALDQFCENTYAASQLAGLVLSILTIFWYSYFVSVQNMHTIKLFNNRTSMHYELAVLNGSFINDIKNANGAFVHFFVGSIFLILGSRVAGASNKVNFNHRIFWCIAAVFMMLTSFTFILSAPLMTLLENSGKNMSLLIDEQEAHKGSLNFFRRSECSENSGTRINQVQEKEKLFCRTLFHLVIVLYMMGFTAVIPMIVLSLSCLEVVLKRKEWKAKTLHRYKPKTPQQISDDKSKSFTVIPENAPEREHYY